jgi:hypothetical protein
MNVWWAYFWPAFAAGLVIGAIAGSIALRVRILPPKEELSREKQIVWPAPRKRRIALMVGFFLAIAAAALWHGPLGAGDRFAAEVERSARQTLGYYEMTQVTAHLQHDPLTRRLILSGPADDFQSSELVRIMGDLPGVSGARWSDKGSRLPLILEGAAVAVLGFLFGLLLAYLVELRRRYNAQWNW